MQCTNIGKEDPLLAFQRHRDLLIRNTGHASCLPRQPQMLYIHPFPPRTVSGVQKCPPKLYITLTESRYVSATWHLRYLLQNRAGHKLEKWLLWAEHTAEGRNEANPWQGNDVQNQCPDSHCFKSTNYNIIHVSLEKTDLISSCLIIFNFYIPMNDPLGME